MTEFPCGPLILPSTADLLVTSGPLPFEDDTATVGTARPLAHSESRTPGGTDWSGTGSAILVGFRTLHLREWAGVRAAQKTRRGFASLHSGAGAGGVILGLQEWGRALTRALSSGVAAPLLLEKVT